MKDREKEERTDYRMSSNHKTVVYVGDFDFRNENVQSQLVKNNARILTGLGFEVFFIGVDRLNTDFYNLKTVKWNDHYLELPNSLNLSGLFRCSGVCKKIIDQLDEIERTGGSISHVVTYQSPTYAIVLKMIAIWCRRRDVQYVVNCADIPVFDSQPFIKRVVMKWNWSKIHHYNKKYADGIIAVSKFIESFYHKDGRKSIVIPPLFDKSNYHFQMIEKKETTSFIYAGTPFIHTNKRVNPKGMKDRLDKIIDLFLELSTEKADYAFSIVGISKEEYITAVPRHKEALETSNQISFLGRQSRFQTLELVFNSDFSINYRDANVMTKAGFSTKIVESVSVGTPVIINDIGDTFDYLEEGKTGFCLSGILVDDANKLSRLCALTKAEREQIKEAVMQKELFSVETYENKMKVFFGTGDL